MAKTLEEAAKEFLSQKRFAVAGVSRKPGEAANIIFRKFRDTGREVYAINPNADEVEGVACYPDLASLPTPVEALVISTPASTAESLVNQCAELEVRHVWMHRAFGEGSVSEAAVEACRRHGICGIPGACPMMFCDPVDKGHKCIRWFARFTRRLPRPI